MKLTRPLSRCFILLAVVLGACSHTPGPDDIPPGADFSANILGDGTKLFVFSLRLARPEGHGMGAMRGQEEEQRSRRPTNVKSMQQALQAMLAENGYCRENYVVLEQYELRNQYFIRGECRDSATESDRTRFVH
jgi:hypothetical protein